MTTPPVPERYLTPEPRRSYVECMGRNNTIDLTPRAMAVLMALRNGPRDFKAIRSAIGDRRTDDTMALLILMSKDMSCGAVSCGAMLGQVQGDARYYLTHDGVGWLETNGLPVAQESRLWRAQEAQAQAAQS